jgi:Kef-type K+ transport system membrane component KefB
MLVLAYVGSILMGGRAIRGYGLPSGSEYVLLGFVLGPHVLGMLDASTIGSFEPVVQVGLCWIALVIGVDYGFVGDRRIPATRLLLGVGLALVSALIVGGTAFVLARMGIGYNARDAALLAIGLAAVSAETTRHAVRWVALRFAASGPGVDLIAEVADADDAVPVILIAALFALAPADGRQIAIPAWSGIPISVGVGFALGGLVAALTRRELRPTELWGLLLGSTLLGIGVLTRVGLSAITTTFAMGLALITLSPHRSELRSALNRTEHAVLLPTLMLAGAHLTLNLPWQSFALAGIVVAAKLVSKLGCGFWLSRLGPIRAAGTGLVGFGLMPTGALSVSLGLACAFRMPGEIGTLILGVAIANVLFGELVGPAALRRALLATGDIRESKPRQREQPVVDAEEALP